jgi:hypothetical protein
MTNLNGDLAQTIKRVQETVTDPKDGNFLGIYVQPEVIHHSQIFYDLQIIMTLKNLVKNALEKNR